MEKLSTLKHIKLLNITDTFRATVDSARSGHGLPESSRYLNERMLFSYLAYRSRHGHGATINEIVRETRLHKTTVNKTLTSLSDLVHKHNGKWHCNEPADGLFKLLPDPRSVKHWSDRYCYLNYYPPSANAKLNGRRFGVNHAVVLSAIISFTKKTNPSPQLSIQLVSSLTEIGRKTVSSIFDDFLHAELISYESGGVKLQLVEQHLAMLQPKETVSPNAQSNDRPEVTQGKYQFKDDGFDGFRKSCQPLFAQSYAEQAIVLARKLRLSEIDFDESLRSAKKQNDDNILLNKVSYPNLGRFFVNRLQFRWDEIQRIDREVEVERQRQEYLNSDRFKAKQKQEQEQANADPTHPFHTVNIESITDRVHLADGLIKNRLAAELILKTFYQHCYAYVSSMKLSSQEEVNMKGRLRQLVIGKALKRLNHHYGGETKATRRELEVAIDDEASKIPGLGPVFQKN